MIYTTSVGNQLIISSLLLLSFLALAALLALLCEESALFVEPDPAALDVASSIVHRHLLSDLGFLGTLFDRILLFALFALGCVCLDLLHDYCDLLDSLILLVFDLVFIGLDTRPLLLALLLLLLGLALEQRNSLAEMAAHDIIDFLLSCKHASEAIYLLLKLSLFLLVLTVLARLLALNLSL